VDVAKKNWLKEKKRIAKRKGLPEGTNREEAIFGPLIREL
jgi:hypothetical protein